MTASHTLTPLSRARSAWLEDQSAEWLRQGLVDAETRDRILGSYEVQSAERRALLALVLLGALMFGIGVLLLIGYNWARLPVNGKIAIIIGSVTLAFAASAVTFARHHRLAGETLAFIGVLLFGNAIWLIAQVLHIRGNFSDAFMWWAIGAIACAWLVRSRAIGAGAAVLVLIWVLAAGHTFDRSLLSFAAIWAATMVVVYQLESPVMLAPAALSAVVWVCWVPDRIQPAIVSVGAAALTSCALYAIGRWHRESNRLGRAWQVTGLATLVIAFVPLLVTDFHKSGNPRVVTWASLVVVLPALLSAGSLGLRWSKREHSDADARSWQVDTAILATGAVLTVWLGLLAAGFGADARWVYAATLGFSLLALGLSVSFIHKALGSDNAIDLVFGVFFALAFLLVRWASLIDSMLWSGVMLLVASGGFFAVARLWQGRDRLRPSALSSAPTGAVR
jgi:uncharacterized membrane protein